MIDSRSESSSVAKIGPRSAIGRFTYSGNPAALHADGAALRLETLALARGHSPQRAIRLHLFLQRPRRLAVAAAQVGHDALEVAGRTARAHASSRPPFLRRRLDAAGSPRPEQQQVALLLRQLRKRHFRASMPNVADSDSPARRPSASCRRGPTARSRRRPATSRGRARCGPGRSPRWRRAPGTQRMRRAAS